MNAVAAGAYIISLFFFAFIIETFERFSLDKEAGHNNCPGSLVDVMHGFYGTVRDSDE